MNIPILLCLDCGNTRLKWGLYDQDACRWLQTGALPLSEIASLPNLLVTLPQAARAVACNVAGNQAAASIQAISQELGLPLAWVQAQAEQCGVKNAYDNPRQLGADRWAALVGARHLHQGAGLVANAGTATTVDVLDADGVFQGGLILPGLNLMRSSLAGNTAQLPLVEGEFSELPRNTVAAIVSGSLHATAGAIERMFAHLRDQPDAVCLLSGGAAEVLAPCLNIPLRRVEFLVLEGLARIGADDMQR